VSKFLYNIIITHHAYEKQKILLYNIFWDNKSAGQTLHKTMTPLF